METGNSTRRKILGTLVTFGLCVVAVRRYLSPPISSKVNLFTVQKKNIPANGALLLPERRVAIIMEEGRYQALRTVCTHLGCTLYATSRGFACPCHGSLFDAHGRVVKGPASRSLERYELHEGDQVITIFF